MLTQLKQYNITIKFSLKGSRGYKRKEGSAKKGKKGKTHERDKKVSNKCSVQKKEKQGNELGGKNISSIYTPS